MTFAETLPLIWPLAFIFVALFILRRVGDDVRPVFINIVNGVAKNAGQHSLAYAMASILAVLSGLNALGEVAVQYHWGYVAAGTKVFAPMLATIVAYLTKPPQFTQAAPDVTPVVAPPNPSP